MTHNKGKKYWHCPHCGRKRYIACIGIIRHDGYDWGVRECSKKHKWEVKVGPLQEIVKIELDRIIPRIKDLFNRDDTFLRNIKGFR